MPDPVITANIIQSAFGPLIWFFEQILVGIHELIPSWGLSIIAMTVVIRIVMLPLTIKQFEGMAKLQQHAPEMKAIQERYKEDKQRQQEELMKFYKENNVNPLASCLPLALQLPVLVSLVYMLRLSLKKDICGVGLKAHHIISDSAIQKATCDSVTHGSAKFLFIPDITNLAHGWILAVLMILYVGSQLVSSLLTSVNADRNQRLIAMGLPFAFAIFILRFPAGLVVYWITTNIATIAQQYIVRRRVGHLMPAKAGTAGAGKVTPAMAVAKGSGGSKEPATAASTPPSARKKKKRSGEKAMIEEAEMGEDELTPAEELEDLLDVIVEAFDVEGDVVVEESDDLLVGKIEGDDLGRLIGHHGQTIEAIQHLAQRIALRGGKGPRIVIDAGGYREHREDVLRGLADRAADGAIAGDRAISLEPMSAAERRFVHEYLRERGDVETYSEGEEPQRRLVVAPPA